MTLESLWTMEFQRADGWLNAGVAVLETGRVFGGDSNFYYLGTFTVSGKRISAKIAVQHYFGGNETAFGDRINRYDIKLTGTLNADLINGTMRRLDNPDLSTLQVRFRHRADLP